jgi:hypothetical protein
VIDLPRETMQSPSQWGPLDTELVSNMPIHGIGRRSHYVLDAQNYDGTRVLNNDHLYKYTDINPPLPPPC